MAEATYVLKCAPDAKLDPVVIIGEALSQGARMVVIPAERLGDDFFRLQTGVAGAFLQKFVTYGVRVAIVGDISRYVAASSALRDLEPNRGRDICLSPPKKDCVTHVISF